MYVYIYIYKYINIYIYIYIILFFVNINNYHASENPNLVRYLAGGRSAETEAMEIKGPQRGAARRQYSGRE